MKPSFWTAACLALIALAAACSPAAPPELAAPAAAQTEARPAPLRLEAPDDPDVGDLPRLIAGDALEAQGYAIESVSLADTAATIIAIERGDLHFASISSASGWTAVSEGAALVAVLDDTASTALVGVRAGITECADLDGRPWASPTPAAPTRRCCTGM